MSCTPHCAAWGPEGAWSVGGEEGYLARGRRCFVSAWFEVGAYELGAAAGAGEETGCFLAYPAEEEDVRRGVSEGPGGGEGG